MWNTGIASTSWRRIEGCFVEKEILLNRRTVQNHLSAQHGGEDVLTVLGKRMAAYMTSNDYVDTSIEKGGTLGFSWYVEHTSVIRQLIRETKDQKKRINVRMVISSECVTRINLDDHVPLTYTSLCDKYHQQLLQIHHAAVHFSWCHYSVARYGDMNCNRLYHLADPVCDGDEHNHQANWKRNQRTQDAVGNL